MQEVYKLDILICLSLHIIQTDYLKDLKEHNIKIVNYIHDLDYYKYYDEIWVIPNYTNDIDFYNSMMKTPTKTISYIWKSDIVELSGYYYKTIPEGVQQLKYAFKNHT